MGTPEQSLEEIEVQLMLDAIYLRYGYDFRGYARASLRRRLAQALSASGLASLADVQHRLLRDRAFFDGVVLDALTVHVTEMFRDPLYHLAFRQQVVPFLRSYPSLKLWIAGCSSGEEAHSLAIILHEEGLHERALIHATDLSPRAIQRAREGIYPVERIKLYADNYRAAGGQASFTSYFTVAHGFAAIAPFLKERIHFAEHNLVSDQVFGEMNLVSCRNVLIYFEQPLQDAVVGLFSRSLVHGGFLCLGTKEGLRLTSHNDDFQEVVADSRIFRKAPRS